MARNANVKPKTVSSLPLLQPDAAGIDIGATEIFVVAPADCDPEPVRSFASFTPDLERLADGLEQRGIRSVARQAYDESIFARQQARYNRRVESKLRAQARTLGFQLIPVQATANPELVR